MPRTERGAPWLALRRLLWALVCLLVAQASGAHTRSESQSSWQIDGTQLRAQLLLPETELARLAVPGQGQPDDATLLRYLQAHVQASAGDRPCQASPGARRLNAVAGYRRFELALDCPGSDALVITVRVLQDQVRTHSHFARVRQGDGQFSEHLLDAEHPSIVLGPAHAADQTGLAEFVWHGMMHIFTGIDHMAFMLGLLLVSRRLRDLAFVITGFTVGHSITLALAVSGVLRPQASAIDALVGATIVLIGAEIVVHRRQRAAAVAACVALAMAALAAASAMGWSGVPALLLLGTGLFSFSYLHLAGQLVQAQRLRLAVTLVFGLIHGFGFAVNLLDLHLPPGRLVELLLGFNLGVELAQMLLVCVAWWLGRLLQRHLSATAPALCRDLAAAVLIGAGSFWFVTRTLA